MWWNWIVSFAFFVWFYWWFLHKFVADSLPPLDAEWSNFLDWLTTFLINFSISYAGILLAGILGSLIAMSISGYNAFRKGWYGFVRITLGNLASTSFTFFGLFSLLTTIGWFWSLVVYGLIWFGVTGWVNSAALQAGNRIGQRIGGVPK